MWLNLEHPHQFFKFFFCLFYTKNLFFLFYPITFTKHPHQFIYFTRYFNKIFILLNFFIISLNYPLPTYALSLSLSLSQKLPTQITFSPANPDPFFTGQSTNQAPQAPIYLSVGLSVRVCFCVCVFLCWFFSVDVFVCGCVCVHPRKRRWGVEVIVYREEREKLVRTKINKIINTHATVIV